MNENSKPRNKRTSQKITILKRKICNKKGVHVKTSLYFNYYIPPQAPRRVYTGCDLKQPESQYRSENRKLIAKLERIAQDKKVELAEYGDNISLYLDRRKYNLIEFIKEVIAKRQKYSIFNNVLSNLKLFLNDGDIPLENIDTKFLYDWKDYLINDCSTFRKAGKLNPNTIRAYLQKLNTLLNIAVIQGHIKENPFRDFKITKVVKEQGIKRDYLTTAEKERIATMEIQDSLDKLYVQAFLFGCETGLRRKSIYNLKWDEIKDEQIQRYDEKTKDYNNIDLSAMAIKILNSLRMNNVYGIEGKVFYGLSYKNMTPAIKRILRPLNLNKHITVHTARRTYCVSLLANGTDIYTVSKMMGHSDVQTTLLYAQALDVTKKEAIKKQAEYKMTL